MKEIATDGYIGVKRMGELDEKPFHEAMKRNYNEEEADERASVLCSLWQEYMRDSEWHPFKAIMVEGKRQVLFLNAQNLTLPNITSGSSCSSLPW